jgi:hypothetical protein
MPNQVILSVAQGGTLFVNVSAVTTSENSEQSMSVDIEASYSSISSITATASVMQTMARKYSSAEIAQYVTATGGDPHLAAQIDPTNPATFTAWASSCTSDTVCGLVDTLEIFKLATNTQASEQLQTYLTLRAMKQSFNYPSFFSSSTVPQPYQPNSVEVTVPPNYQIIGGGAAVNAGGNNFLTGSYPALDSNGSITGWIASSHDVDNPSSPTDVLTAYAVAVYDPDGLVSVTANTALGTNPNIGRDSAVASAVNILTGGGLSVQVPSGFYKFIVGCYPSTSNSWTGAVSDFEKAASGVTLTVFALDMLFDSTDLLITSSRYSTVPFQQEFGRTNASLSGVNLCSGGGNLLNSTFGNLVQQHCPTRQNEWSIYQKDSNTHCNVTVTAYVLGLSATFANIEGRQWDDPIHTV